MLDCLSMSLHHRVQVILVNLGTNDWKCNNIPGKALLLSDMAA